MQIIHTANFMDIKEKPVIGMLLAALDLKCEHVHRHLRFAATAVVMCEAALYQYSAVRPPFAATQL